MIARFLLTAFSLTAAAHAAPTYIQAGRVMAVPGKPILGPSTIIVDGDRILEVRAGYADPPAGARLVDLKDKIVLPGLIDSADVLRDPAGTLQMLCTALEIDWDPAMLRWERGFRDTDGLWAAHWYDTVAASDRFGPLDDQPVELGRDEQAVADACRPDYDYLSRFALRSI